MLSTKADIKINFGLRFEKHDYSKDKERLLDIKKRLDKELDVNLSTEYGSTLVGFCNFNSLDEFNEFYVKILEIANRFDVDIKICIDKGEIDTTHK